MSLSEPEPTTLKQLMADAQPAKKPALIETPVAKAPAPVQPVFVAQRTKRIDDPHAYASQLMYEGRSRLQIVKELESRGLYTEEAQQIYTEVTRGMQGSSSSSTSYSSSSYSSDTDAAFKQMALGALICVIGIVVTVGSYSAVSRTGGSYTIAYGAIIVGGFRFLRGAYLYFG